MNHRERVLKIMHYQPVDRMPVVHFGFWTETLQVWAQEGHITAEQASQWADHNSIDKEIGDKLGFDFNWLSCVSPDTGLRPLFDRKVVQEFPDGSRHVLDANGAIILEKPGVTSIPLEVDHLLKNRSSWEEHYRSRLQFDAQRITDSLRRIPDGLSYLKDKNRSYPLGLHCGSLLGQIRNWLGMEGLSYVYMDDEALFDEIIDTVGNLCYRCVEATLATGASFDFGHFWEDICFKNGPLVIPSVFEQKVGPWYQKICDLLKKHGITIVSLDCDGLIDSLIPTWIHHGVNTMFPIEVGTWEANIGPWREKYGRELRGVGGTDKKVFALDRAVIDQEIERLKPLVAMGGYIPCPDHRIPPDAQWDLVRYYCDKMREIL